MRPTEAEVKSSVQFLSSPDYAQPGQESRPQTWSVRSPNWDSRSRAPALRPRPHEAPPPRGPNSELPSPTGAAIETQKAPWLPPAEKKTFRQCRRQPYPSHCQFCHSHQLPSEGSLRNVWSIRIRRRAPACPGLSCAGSKAWISASSPGTSTGAGEAGQAALAGAGPELP